MQRTAALKFRAIWRDEQYLTSPRRACQQLTWLKVPVSTVPKDASRKLGANLSGTPCLEKSLIERDVPRSVSLECNYILEGPSCFLNNVASDIYSKNLHAAPGRLGCLPVQDRWLNSIVLARAVDRPMDALDIHGPIMSKSATAPFRQ